MPKSVLVRWIEEAEARRFREQALLQRAAGEPVVVISVGPSLKLGRRTSSLFGLAEPDEVAFSVAKYPPTARRDPGGAGPWRLTEGTLDYRSTDAR